MPSRRARRAVSSYSPGMGNRLVGVLGRALSELCGCDGIAVSWRAFEVLVEEVEGAGVLVTEAEKVLELVSTS